MNIMIFKDLLVFREPAGVFGIVAAGTYPSPVRRAGSCEARSGSFPDPAAAGRDGAARAGICPRNAPVRLQDGCKGP
jgi:hypothetical protein